MSCLLGCACPSAATLGRFKPGRRHVVNKLNAIVIKQVSNSCVIEGHRLHQMCELTSRQRTAALLCPSGARRHQRGRGLSVPVLPPAALSALAENRAGQRCEHYFTALFITAQLRSATTPSPFEWNTSCRADAQMGWIQSLSKTCPAPTSSHHLSEPH